jgi:hypothetical protein
MSLARQKELVEMSITVGASIPGLGIVAVINNLAEKSEEIKLQVKIIQDEIKENRERGMTKEEAEKEAEKQIKDLINKYKDSIRQVVIEQIAIIKQQYKVVKEGLERIPDDVKAAIKNISLPPAISTPPGAPNPIYALNLAKTTKNALLGTLSVMIVAFTTMLIAANKISFVFPDSILSLYETLKTSTQIISSIPV